MAKRTKNIRFQTRRSGQKSKAKKFAAVLAVCALVVAFAVTTVSIVKNGDDTFETAEQTTRRAPKDKDTQVTMDADFLIFSENSDKDCLDFMWLVNVRLPERIFEVTFISPELESDSGDSFNEVFRKGGETKLRDAVESTYDIDVAKYLFSNETTFKSIINYFGGVNITVPEQIIHKTDEMNLVLVKGRQNMKGETFYKYLRYVVLMGDSMIAERNEAIEAVFASVFEKDNTESRTKIFSKLSNTLKTDITIVDFSKADEAIVLLMENGVKKTEHISVTDLR